jgi:hypothetical protein
MKTSKEQIIELHTGQSIEEIEENNRTIQELITNKNIMKQIGNRKYSDEEMIKINDCKKIIYKLSEMQDHLYKELIEKELGFQNTSLVADKDQDFLFDYIFNDFEITNREKETEV